MWHLKIFQFFLYRMRHLVESHAFSREVFAFIYTLIGVIDLVFDSL